jgi:hypothetical protein
VEDDLRYFSAFAAVGVILLSRADGFKPDHFVAQIDLTPE